MTRRAATARLVASATSSGVASTGPAGDLRIDESYRKMSGGVSKGFLRRMLGINIPS